MLLLSTSTAAGSANADAQSAADSGPTMHFGYESVPTGEKEERVQRVFENVADSYGVMNDFVSAGLH